MFVLYSRMGGDNMHRRVRHLTLLICLTFPEVEGTLNLSILD